MASLCTRTKSASSVSDCWLKAYIYFCKPDCLYRCCQSAAVYCNIVCNCKKFC